MINKIQRYAQYPSGFFKPIPCDNGPVCLSSDVITLEKQLEAMKKERDEARRDLCLEKSTYSTPPEAWTKELYANQKGWDYLFEATKQLEESK